MSYRTLLRWAALPVTDRRWAAPLAAVALGFGIFAGVAIGPGAAGTLATAPLQVIELPFEEDGEGAEATEPAPAEPAGGGGFGGEEESSFGSFAPLPAETAETPVTEPAPAAKPTKPEGETEQQPEAQELKGTVVHVNEAAGSYTVVEAGGVMSAVHAGKLPAAGSQIEVPIRALANGTLAEAGTRKRNGEKAKAELAGIVTFLGTDATAPAYTVSNRGTSALIHVAPDPSGAAAELPELGAYATVTVSIGEGGLEQRQLLSGGAPFTHADLAGIVAAVDEESGQLLISADDVRESGADLAIALSPKVDVSALVEGESILAGADIGADGVFTLTGLASDEHLKGADDAGATQGDLVPPKQKGQQK